MKLLTLAGWTIRFYKYAKNSNYLRRIKNVEGKSKIHVWKPRLVYLAIVPLIYLYIFFFF